MVLYKLKDTNDRTLFIPLKPTTMNEQGFLEKKMEQWLAFNPKAVLPEDEERVLVFSQETPFENMTDIIAVDENGNIVIIEVKRGQTPRDVIAQALEYASDVAEWDYDMLNKKACKYFTQQNLDHTSLLEAFSNEFSVAPGDFTESQFNQQQRIIIIGETISQKIERTARWLLKRGISISCLSYTCYLSDDHEKDIFLDLQEVVRPIECQGGARQSKELSAPPTEQEVAEHLPDGLKKIYLELKERVSNFGQEVQATATSIHNRLIFKAAKNFVEIHYRIKENCLRIFVRREGFNIPQNQSAEVHGLTVTRVPDTHGWTLNHWFNVNESSDLDAVTVLLRQSYEAISK